MPFISAVALLAVVTAVTCALPGTFLVLRHQAMLVEAMSHAVLPGIVIGAILSGTTHSPLMVVAASAMGLLVVLGAERLRAGGLVTGVLVALAVLLIGVGFSLVNGSGVREVTTVPVSALVGDNVAERSEATPWYEGPSVLELLETIPVNHGRADDLDFRFNIQYVLREHASDYRAYAGRVGAGAVSVGDEILAPHGRTTTVAGSVPSATGSVAR